MADGLINGKHAQNYAKKIDKDKWFNIKLNKYILDNIKPNKKICDMACGSGISIDLLKDDAKEIIGVDASDEMIKICKNKFSKDKNVKIIKAFAQNTGLKSGYFDHVIIRFALHHMKDKKSAMDETERILRKDGKAIILDHTYKNKILNFAADLFFLIFMFKPRIFWHHMISIKDYETIFSNKFKIMDKQIIQQRLLYGNAFMMILEKK